MADKMKRIITLAELLVKQQKEVEKKDTELKAAKAAMLRTERDDLPELFKELEIIEVKLKDGSKVGVVDDVSTAITVANKDKAHEWLIKHDFGGLIKTEISIAFARGAHDKATKAHAVLAKRYDGAELREGVHASTLKSFVKEQLQEGKKIPFKLFSIHPYSKAVIKRS